MPNYSDLNSLIFQNPDARQFYNELPKNVRSRVNTLSGAITSYESLIGYAENLVRGEE